MLRMTCLLCRVSSTSQELRAKNLGYENSTIQDRLYCAWFDTSEREAFEL